MAQPSLITDACLVSGVSSEATWLVLDRASLTEEMLARFHSQGKLVAAWDVKVGSDVGRLEEMSLDAVVTNYPDVFVS